MQYEKKEVNDLFNIFEEKLNKSVDSYRRELSDLRAGRANPRILDKITVDYYGTPTPINQVGNISVPEARVISITVWDKNALSLVEKAIIAANIGLTPNNDGKTIRLIFPELTEEKRKELVKNIKAMAENSKVALRNSRRDINDKFKSLNKIKVITDDEQKEYEQVVDKELNKHIEQIDNLTKEKEKEVLSV